MKLLLKLGLCAAAAGLCTFGIWKLLQERDAIVETGQPAEPAPILEEQMAEITFAGGCFWGTQQYLRQINGVLSTQVGYANGTVEHPTYQQVCTGETGFAEAVRVIYNPSAAPLSFLLDLYYESIDPTAVNRQGNDRGSQYRTGVYYVDDDNKHIIEASLAELAKRYDKPVAVECLPLQNFYPAEDYHQDYLEKNPGGYCHIPQSLFERAAGAAPAAAEAENIGPPIPVAQVSEEPEPAPLTVEEEAEEQPAYRKLDRETLKDTLTPQQFAVTQENATEPPFRNAYWKEFGKGIYVDITTGEPLFLSADKFESGCGWPSFSRPIDRVLLKELEDASHGMYRTEVRSSLGDAHLGHVFEDGPEELGGLRYCINSAALRFIPFAEMEAQGYGEFLPLLEE